MSHHSSVRLQWVESAPPEHLAAVRLLFTEYANTLDRSVCLRDFEQELATLPGRYDPPEGRLVLALTSQGAAGCVGFRKMADGICEMKRLYVRPGFRGQGIGRSLAEAVIRAAREAGYDQIRLDTLPTMAAAIALYESLGFHRLPAAGDCCSGAAIDMELLLR
jgi:putative acetyltransferase